MIGMHAILCRDWKWFAFELLLNIIRLSQNRFYYRVLRITIHGDNMALVYFIDGEATVGFDEWLRLAPFAVASSLTNYNVFHRLRSWSVLTGSNVSGRPAVTGQFLQLSTIVCGSSRFQQSTVAHSMRLQLALIVFRYSSLRIQHRQIVVLTVKLLTVRGCDAG